MSFFELEEDSDENSMERENDAGKMVSVMSHQKGTLRNTIPKEVREKHRMSAADHLYIEPTENGFKAELIQR